MTKVTCQNCKFLARVETDTHPSFKCLHKNGIDTPRTDPLTGKDMSLHMNCSDKNKDLDCQDFEQWVGNPRWRRITEYLRSLRDVYRPC